MITSTRKGKLSVALSNARHEIVSAVDGALDPHELVEAALAACTGLTLEMYATRKNWDVSNLQVEVRIVKEGSETQLERRISFGSLPEEHKAKLIEIANKCPIHKLLESNIKIETYEK